VADRIAVHRIIAGVDKDRKVIMPGTRFNTDEYGIDAEALEKFDKRAHCASRATRRKRTRRRLRARVPRAGRGAWLKGAPVLRTTSRRRPSPSKKAAPPGAEGPTTSCERLVRSSYPGAA
jgi:hypothetical protein